MGTKLENKPRVRKYEPIQGQTLVWSTASQLYQWTRTLSAKTGILVFEIGNLAITAGSSPAILDAAMQSIRLTINNNEVLDPIGADIFVQMVQIPESLSLATKGAHGLIFSKAFDPPLAAGTSLQVSINIDTLANSFSGSPTGASATFNLYAYDSTKATGATYQYYKARYTTVAGIVVDTWTTIDIPRFNRHIETIVILVKSSGTPTGELISELEILADGTPVIRLGSQQLIWHMDQFQRRMQLAVPAGYYAVLFPGGGFDASANENLTIRLKAFATDANATIELFEVFTA